MATKKKQKQKYPGWKKISKGELEVIKQTVTPPNVKTVALNTKMSDKKRKWVKKTQSDHIKNSTGAELKLREIFADDANAVEYCFEVSTKNGKKKIYFIDLLLLKGKIAIEVDGGYHNELGQKRKDTIKDRALIAGGYKVLRVKNEDVSDPQKIKDYVSLLRTTDYKIITYRKDYKPLEIL